jgi:hypothetical protein
VSGILLFGHLRRWLTNLVIAVGVGAGIAAAGPLHYSLNPDDGYLIAVIAQLPLVSAVVLQASAVSAMSQQEQHAARVLGRYRAFSYIGLSVTVALVLGVSASFLNAQAAADPSVELGGLAVIRNFLALTGASFIGASCLGASLGWVLPTAWAVLPYVLLTQGSQRHEILTLVGQPDGSFTAAATSLIVWLTGLALASASRQDVFDLPALAGRALHRRRGRG